LIQKPVRFISLALHFASLVFVSASLVFISDSPVFVSLRWGSQPLLRLLWRARRWLRKPDFQDIIKTEQ